MSLQEEINAFSKEFLSKVPQEVLDVIMPENQALFASGIDRKALSAGDLHPSFSLPNQIGETVSSNALLKKGPLVISFYRGTWCPYCNLELPAFQKVLPEIKNLGASIVAISPQLPDNSLTMAEKHSLEFDVLSDVGNKVAREFGLVFTLPEKLQEIYQQLGLDIPAANGDDSYEIPIPATYVVNTDGSIIEAFVDLDYRKRMEPEAVLQALRDLQVDLVES